MIKREEAPKGLVAVGKLVILLIVVILLSLYTVFFWIMAICASRDGATFLLLIFYLLTFYMILGLVATITILLQYVHAQLKRKKSARTD